MRQLMDQDVTRHDPHRPKPCPSWCRGADELPEAVNEGFLHSSPPSILIATHGSNQCYRAGPLEVWIEAWVPHRAADPPDGLITWALHGVEGPLLTAKEAKGLITILEKLIDQVEGKQQRTSGTN